MRHRLWVKNANIPQCTKTDADGLTWLLVILVSQKKTNNTIAIFTGDTRKAVETGDIQAKADMAAGLYFQEKWIVVHQQAVLRA